MSINAINSVSLYEYYYQINQEDKRRKKSPLADEMKEYGLTPTEDEAMNVALLNQAKALEKAKSANDSKETSPSDRPWADLMYQLNIPFNENPQDDIQDIKDELALLIDGINDEQLSKEVKDLENYVENLYISFSKNSLTNSVDMSSLLYNQLNNISMVNRASL